MAIDIGKVVNGCLVARSNTFAGHFATAHSPTAPPGRSGAIKKRDDQFKFDENTITSVPSPVS